MIAHAPDTYSPKKWALSGLHGISDNTLAVHFGLGNVDWAAVASRLLPANVGV
jgi:hypothetical protein